MDERKRLKMKIASSLSMCILSLFALVTLTLCWFAMNDKTSGSGMKVEAADDNIVLGYEIYTLNDENEMQKNDNFTKFPTNSAANAGKTKTVVKIYIKKDDNEPISKINLFAETDTDYFIGNGTFNPDKETTAFIIDENGKEEHKSNTLSSVVSFGIVDDIDSTPKNTVPLVKNDNTMEKSVSIGDVTPTENLETFNDVSCYVAYVYIDYDQLLINRVYSANIGNDVLNLKGDETSIEISYVADFKIRVQIEKS